VPEAVSFMNGSTLLERPLSTLPRCHLTTTSLGTGTFSLTAQYSGNANFLSALAAVSVTVSSQATTTA